MLYYCLVCDASYNDRQKLGAGCSVVYSFPDRDSFLLRESMKHPVNVVAPEYQWLFEYPNCSTNMFAELQNAIDAIKLLRKHNGVTIALYHDSTSLLYRYNDHRRRQSKLSKQMDWIIDNVNEIHLAKGLHAYNWCHRNASKALGKLKIRSVTESTRNPIKIRIQKSEPQVIEVPLESKAKRRSLARLNSGRAYARRILRVDYTK